MARPCASACGPIAGPAAGCPGDVTPAGSAGVRLLQPGWLVQTDRCAGSSAACTTLARSPRTVSRSTASFSRAANAATVASASYRARLNRRSTRCCTRRRTGLNTAAAASVATATATGVCTPNTWGGQQYRPGVDPSQHAGEDRVGHRPGDNPVDVVQPVLQDRDRDGCVQARQ